MEKPQEGVLHHQWRYDRNHAAFRRDARSELRSVHFRDTGEFAGYRLDYSKTIQTKEGRSRFSWIILKAHTNNRGEVRLRTTDPRDPPEINFKSFGDGQRANDSDLKALQWGVDYVRRFMEPVREVGTTKGEYLPGAPRTEQALSDFIMTRGDPKHAS